MEEKDPKRQEQTADPVVMIIDRRSDRQKELTPAEIMKLVRKRSAKLHRKETGSEDDDAG